MLMVPRYFSSTLSHLYSAAAALINSLFFNEVIVLVRGKSTPHLRGLQYNSNTYDLLIQNTTYSVLNGLNFSEFDMSATRHFKLRRCFCPSLVGSGRWTTSHIYIVDNKALVRSVSSERLLMLNLVKKLRKRSSSRQEGLRAGS